MLTPKEREDFKSHVKLMQRKARQFSARTRLMREYGYEYSWRQESDWAKKAAAAARRALFMLIEDDADRRIVETGNLS